MSRSVVSFTSSPFRLPLFLPHVMQWIDAGLPVDAWQLHLPERYRDDASYSESLIAQVPSSIELIRHPGPDPGPALKLLGPLRVESETDTTVLTIDDDVAYSPRWLSALIARQKATPDAAVGGKGFLWADGQLKPMRCNAAPCDVLQGYGGVAYPRHALDEQRLGEQLADAPGALRFSDDVLLSNHLASRGVPRQVFAPTGETLNHLPWGDTDPQALKQIGGGVHTRYREAAEVLQRSRTWALTPLL